MGFGPGGLAAITAVRIDEVMLRSIGDNTRTLKTSALSEISVRKIGGYSSHYGQAGPSARLLSFPLNSLGLSRESKSLLGSRRGSNSIGLASTPRTKPRNCKTLVRNDHQYDDLEGDFSYRRSSAPNRGPCEEAPTEQPEYEIKVSKEKMGVFQYVEKVKRARLRDLSDTLRQVSGACLFFSFIKGFISPLVEVFKTDPPNWGKLILFLGAFDAFAISYMAVKAREPLDKLSTLATEFATEDQMMGSIEKEEELMLALALELLGLFGRLRYLTLVMAVSQLAHITHALLQVRGIQTNLPDHFANFVASWLGTPWA